MQIDSKHNSNYKNIYTSSKRIRFIEEMIAQKYPEGKMRCPTHLSIGQETTAAAVCEVLRVDDFAISTHRSHAHYLAKGGDLKSMIAEIYGKGSGCSGGKGGSMHLTDTSVGFIASTAIVGNTIPIGTGLGWSIRLNKGSNISVVFLGDGAIEEGVFFESLNFAIVKKLPVLFVCENNLYSVYSHFRARQPEDREIFKMVQGFGIETAKYDGNNGFEVFDNLSKHVEKMRVDHLPFFVELTTYRWREHCGPNYDNDIGYRTEEEFLAWQAKDPISFLETHLLEKGIIDNAFIESTNSNIEKEAKEAFDFAEGSEFPSPELAFKHEYRV